MKTIKKSEKYLVIPDGGSALQIEILAVSTAEILPIAEKTIVLKYIGDTEIFITMSMLREILKLVVGDDVGEFVCCPDCEDKGGLLCSHCQHNNMLIGRLQLVEKL